MATIYDYLNYYGNYSFQTINFNDMDNILFSVFAYLPLEKIEFNNNLTLEEICDKLQSVECREKTMKYKAKKLLLLVKDMNRYKEIKITDFVNILDSNTQFCALSIRFLDSIYVSFRGTDNSLVGWKENFELSYCFPTMAQVNAAKYLDKYVDEKIKKVYIGGHSKGGNLAVVSALDISDKLFKKIIKIYNNDGPGLLDEQYSSYNYKRISKKITTFLPEASVVGILLNNDNKKVVKSLNKKFYQHDVTSWECFGEILIPGVLSKSSIKHENKINKWLNETTFENRKMVFENFFEVIQSSGIKEFRDFKRISLKELQDMIRKANSISKKDEKMLIDTIKLFLLS